VRSAHPALGAHHDAMREMMCRFVVREIAPDAAAWDEAEAFPRKLYRKATDASLFGIGFPEDEAVQTLGGGGSQEIMKDLAARQLG
jgi:acyl-CoA dehydrogenase